MAGGGGGRPVYLLPEVTFHLGVVSCEGPPDRDLILVRSTFLPDIYLTLVNTNISNRHIVNPSSVEDCRKTLFNTDRLSRLKLTFTVGGTSSNPVSRIGVLFCFDFC